MRDQTNAMETLAEGDEATTLRRTDSMSSGGTFSRSGSLESMQRNGRLRRSLGLRQSQGHVNSAAETEENGVISSPMRNGGQKIKEDNEIQTKTEPPEVVDQKQVEITLDPKKLEPETGSGEQEAEVGGNKEEDGGEGDKMAEDEEEAKKQPRRKFKLAGSRFSRNK